MRATRAYIASAGTAAVMLGASFAMFLMLSAFVAFGSWPGAKDATQVDQVVLRAASAARSKPVAVNANAVAVARRRAAQTQVAGFTGNGGHRTAPSSGTPVAQAPTAGGGGSAATTAPAGVTKPLSSHPAQTVAQNVQSTTRTAVQNVQQQVQNVQSQVNQVVGQVIGGPQTNTAPTPTSNTVQQVKNTAGSLLGH